MNISAGATSTTTSQRLLKSPKRIAKSPSLSATARARKILSTTASTSNTTTREQIKQEEEEIAINSHAGSSAFTPYKRKYTPSPLGSPIRQPDLSRASTFISDIDTNDASSTRWTKELWKKLEQYYIDRNRDYKKAATAFYYKESLITIDLPHRPNGREPETKELWSIEQITWRSQCLDTSAKFHNGLLPSERKLAKRRKMSNGSSSSSGIPGLFKSPSTIASATSSSTASTPSTSHNRIRTTTTPTRMTTTTATTPTSFPRSTIFSTPSRINNNNTSYQSGSSSLTR